MVVRLIQTRVSILEIERVDILDGTPLLDIKPCVPEFDHPGRCRIGRLEKARGEIKEK